MKNKLEWCKTQNTHIDWLGQVLHPYGHSNANKILDRCPKRISCPDCGRRFLPYIAECHDLGCLHYYLPAHKKRIKCRQKSRQR